MIIVLEDDLIAHLGYSKDGMGELIGEWITYLAEQLRDLIEKKYKPLPPKARPEKYSPCVYWVLLPLHAGFSYLRNEARKNYNSTVETTVKTVKFMRVVKLKDNWTFKDESLVKQGKITEVGLYAYWDAIDAAFKFNASKHDTFTARMKIQSMQALDKRIENKGKMPQSGSNDNERNETFKEDMKTKPSTSTSQIHNEMPTFFKKHRLNDQFHWNANHSSKGNKFLVTTS